jgi:hypothetical protein
LVERYSSTRYNSFHLGWPEFGGGDAIALRCIATAATAATAGRLPPSAVQRGEGRYFAAAAKGRRGTTVHRESELLFIFAIRFGLIHCGDRWDVGNYLIGGVQFLDRKIKVSLFLSLVTSSGLFRFTCLFSKPV